MKKYSTLTLILIVLISFTCCKHQGSDNYAEQLKVISNHRMYEKLVEDNTEKALLDIEEFIPGIVLDIRYATKNNFTKRRIYKSAKAYLRMPAAEALKKAQSELNEQGLGFKIFDAYRPYSATVLFYQIYPDTTFVAAPWRGSKHNRGCAVDLTIINLATGEELEMPTPFDDFTEKASQNYMDLPDHVLANRKLLVETMTSNGFLTIPNEWWHYDYKGWEDFELMNIPMEELEAFNEKISHSLLGTR